MDRLNPKCSIEHKNNRLTFADKFKDLLPGVEFEESIEMLEARTAVLEALKNSQDPNFLQRVWIEYAHVCEHAIDSKSDRDPQARAQLQIAALVHKALIFREAEDMLHYGDDLRDAEEYAFNMYLDEIAEAIGAELDNLAS